MAASRNDTRLVIGGVPRAELLPPELELEKKAASQRRSLVVLVMVVIAAVGVSYGVVTVWAQTSQVALDDANERSADLLAQQAKYIEVRQLTAQVDAAEEARQVATSTEIDWQAYLTQMIMLLTADGPNNSIGVTLITVTSATPLAPFAETTVPLQQPRVAEITMTGLTNSIPDLTVWADSIAEMDGYADASLTTITDVGGAYSYTLVVHINEDVFTERFSDEDDSNAGEEGE